MVQLESFDLFYPNDQQALYDINLSIKPKECVLFCGESGCGKTSLINSINGIARHYDNCRQKGTIRIKGMDSQKMNLYELSRNISSVFQNPKTHFFNVNTTTELLFYLENIGMARDEMKVKLDELCQLFPISHLLDRNIFCLSGGEKQILSVAACYLAATDIIVLDEPSSNLDDQYTSILANMLQILKQAGITILISEHRISYLMDVVDRIYYLKEGSVKEAYSRCEFLNLSRKQTVQMGLRSIHTTQLTNKIPELKPDLLIEELTYLFPQSNEGLHVEQLPLALGHIYGIIGKNGIGKSSFIKSLIGINRCKRDSIWHENSRLSKKKRLRASGLVMQDVNHQLFADTVWDEVTLGIKTIPAKRIESVLKDLDIWQYKDAHPMSLSGGQKQRVAIASVILSNPTIICFDEPTSGMDFSNMKRISRLITSCIDPKKIIFVISHDVEFLNETVDCILNLESYQIGSY